MNENFMLWLWSWLKSVFNLVHNVKRTSKYKYVCKIYVKCNISPHMSQ